MSNGLCSLWGYGRDRDGQINTLLGVIRLSLGCSLSQSHLCLLTCGGLLGRGRKGVTDGGWVCCKNPKACCSLIIQHSLNLTVYFSSTVILPYNNVSVHLPTLWSLHAVFIPVWKWHIFLITFLSVPVCTCPATNLKPYFCIYVHKQYVAHITFFLSYLSVI